MAIGPVQNSVNGSLPKDQCIGFHCLGTVIYSNVFAMWLCHAAEKCKAEEVIAVLTFSRKLLLQILKYLFTEDYKNYVRHFYYKIGAQKELTIA